MTGGRAGRSAVSRVGPDDRRGPTWWRPRCTRTRDRVSRLYACRACAEYCPPQPEVLTTLPTIQRRALSARPVVRPGTRQLAPERTLARRPGYEDAHTARRPVITTAPCHNRHSEQEASLAWIGQRTPRNLTILDHDNNVGAMTNWSSLRPRISGSAESADARPYCCGGHWL